MWLEVIVRLPHNDRVAKYTYCRVSQFIIICGVAVWLGVIVRLPHNDRVAKYTYCRVSQFIIICGVAVWLEVIVRLPHNDRVAKYTYCRVSQFIIICGVAVWLGVIVRLPHTDRVAIDILFVLHTNVWRLETMGLIEAGLRTLRAIICKKNRMEYQLLVHATISSSLSGITKGVVNISQGQVNEIYAHGR